MELTSLEAHLSNAKPIFGVGRISVESVIIIDESGIVVLDVFGLAAGVVILISLRAAGQNQGCKT
jgi:hypothetical protein